MFKFQYGVASTLALLVLGCAATTPLSEYRAFSNSKRVILPDEYVAYLKSEKFKHGELDHLPMVAVILHHDDVPGYLTKLGYQEAEWTTLQIGTTDPNLMYIVHPHNEKQHPFIINRGLPGAGGISTQTAELAALGVKQVVHIGTAGFIGTSLPDRAIVISRGSYKDGAAVLLSDKPDESIARPDQSLTQLLEIMSLKRTDDNAIDFIELVKLVTEGESVGYTSPIFYLQPEGAIRDLIVGQRFAEERPAFVEMEESPFFETARRMNISAASIVIGSDRYVVDAKGELVHTFFDSTADQELKALKLAINTLTKHVEAKK